MKVDYNRHVFEGWSVQDFIDELEPQFNMIVNGNSWLKPFESEQNLKNWCMDNQPYYKKHIPEVFNYFNERRR